MDRRLALSTLLFTAASVAGDEPKDTTAKVPGLLNVSKSESEEQTKDAGRVWTEAAPVLAAD